MHRRHATHAAQAALAATCAVVATLRGARWAFAALPSQRGAEDFSKVEGVGMVNEVIGELVLPKPVVFSPHGASELWRDLGVNVRSAGSEDSYVVAPQSSSYRALNRQDESYLRTMTGDPVDASRNPGIRIEPGFVSESEEMQITEELFSLARTYGYDFAAAGEADAATSWRLTGREEKQAKLQLAPWGWGPEFAKDQLPTGLARVLEKLEALGGSHLGPIRDITVNIRSSVDYQMTPHIDPLPDGPNSFILSLMSGAVVTFSPVTAMRVNAIRANDDEEYARNSYTDEDLDCLVPQRAVYHFSGDARYLWTHAVRPPASHTGENGPEAFERWGTWDKVLRRGKERAAIIFTFADPLNS